MRRTLHVAFLALATGCFHVNYVTNRPPAAAPAYDAWHTDVVWGLVEVSDPVDVATVCPNGYARIESQLTFVQGLLQYITIGIYNPQSVTITCASAHAETPAPVPAIAPAAASATPSTERAMKFGEAVGLVDTAKVTAVDARKHTVTLQGPSGKTRTYKVSKKVNAKRIKVGDEVAVEVAEAVAVSLNGPHSEPIDAGVANVRAAGKNAFGDEEVVRLAAKVSKINKKTPSVTVVAPTGGKVTLKLRDATALEGLQVGDDLDVMYTEEVVMALVPPKAKM